jgi:TRAP-type C4-dicarboxylate transport system permease small subunit
MKNSKFKIIDYFEYYILAFSLLIILTGVILGIAYRWLPFTLQWTVELCQTAFNWMVWIGISLCIKENTHTRLTFIYDLFPPDKKKILKIFSLVCFIFLLVVIGYNAAKMNLYYLEKEMKTPAMRLSYFWVRIPIVIGCVISIIRLIKITIEELTKKILGGKSCQ